MKTALQELIDYAINNYGSDSDVANDIVVMAMHLNKIEKQQILDAFNKGGINSRPMFDLKYSGIVLSEEEYYNNTFK